MDALHGATVKSLRLKPVTSTRADSPCSEAVETMRDKGFDQLPVLAPKGGRLVGLVTLGNILSYISRGRATSETPVASVMFDFSRISENLTHPFDLSEMSASLTRSGDPKHRVANGDPSLKEADSDTASKIAQRSHRQKFVEITMSTPLSTLSRFLEWNSAAIVTEKDKGSDHGLKPVAVVTKVDLLSWLMRHGQA